MLTVPYLAVSPANLGRSKNLKKFYQEEDKWLFSTAENINAQK